METKANNVEASEPEVCAGDPDGASVAESPPDVASPLPKPQGVAVEVEGIVVVAGDRVLLEDANAQFPAGQVTLIVGPSGAGKSIFLRVLAA